ncbi:MAG TPA: right-handed parallel beta-helix repeat-containing protein [Streptosporangiaceae bacterium]|nr:right-handed parallel beta-helix repeat-containing protein [Streptosporangiaceae bacterium]
MRKAVKGMLALAAGGGLAVAPMLAAGSAQALPPPTTVYVSPTGSIFNAGTSCQTATFTSINTAIVAVASGGTVNVCHGTYFTDALAIKPLTLWGHGAIINATGKPNGVTVLAPNVTVRDLFVRDAHLDGIFVHTHGARILDNASFHNGSTGISFNGASSSIAFDNTTRFNKAGGINLADDFGPTSNIRVIDNDASDNPGGCGIIMASHTGAGVSDNLVRDNVADDNGTIPASSGSGILMATGAPHGAVYNNLVDHNWVSGNGLAGVTVHGHIPGLNLNGNAVTNNVIGTNNLDGDPIGLAPPGVNVPDPWTTGVLVASSSPLSITVANNSISDNHVGIWRTSLVKIVGVNTNTYTNVLIPVRYAP